MMLQKRFHMKSRRTNLPHALYQCAPVAGQVGTIFVRRLCCYFRGLDSTRNCHTPSSDAPTDIVLFHTNGNFQSKKCEKMQSKMTKVYQSAPVSPTLEKPCTPSWTQREFAFMTSRSWTVHFMSLRCSP